MSTVLERGDLFLFYRSRVGIDEVDELLDDVQRFLFRPRTGVEHGTWR
jgi:hypothetical protein